MNTRISITLLALWIALLTTATQAQNFPTRPMRVLVPLAAGGGMDSVSRNLAQSFAEAFGQSVVVDNRPGAGSLVALGTLADAAPDGHTVMMISATTVIYPLLYKSPLDPVRDFAPVSQVTAQGYVLVVHPTLPARNVKELVQIAKQRPGALVYGSPGIATGIHLASEFFALNVGVQLTHIPYKGGAPAMVDLAAGNIALMFSTFSTAGQHLTSGRLRALAVADGVRNKVYATVPTMSEAGFAGLEATTWHGMVARTGVPRAIVMRINSEIARIVETDEVKKAFAATGLDLAVGTADEFDAYIRSEYVKWEKVARVAKIVTD